MRVKTYFVFDGAATWEFSFQHEHFKTQGIPPTPLVGMPRSEALELINKWNREPEFKDWRYWIA